MKVTTQLTMKHKDKSKDQSSMTSAIRVLKADEVEVSGLYSLATSRSSCLASRDAAGIQDSPQARIVEQHSQYAVLEITCACGQTLQVKCDYSQAMAAS